MPGRNFMQKTFRCRRRVISFLEAEEGSKEHQSHSDRAVRTWHPAEGDRILDSRVDARGEEPALSKAD